MRSAVDLLLGAGQGESWRGHASSMGVWMYQERPWVTLPGMTYFVLAFASMVIGYRFGTSMERARALLDAVPSMLISTDPADPDD
jgi:hypothetical protein